MSVVAERLTKAGQRFVDDMTRCRGMDWVRLGMMVESYGELGTIVGMNSGANLDVVFANQLKWGKHKHNCHPWCETRYFDEAGRVIKDYTGTARAVRNNAVKAPLASADPTNIQY